MDNKIFTKSALIALSILTLTACNQVSEEKVTESQVEEALENETGSKDGENKLTVTYDQPGEKSAGKKSSSKDQAKTKKKEVAEKIAKENNSANKTSPAPANESNEAQTPSDYLTTDGWYYTSISYDGSTDFNEYGMGQSNEAYLDGDTLVIVGTMNFNSTNENPINKGTHKFKVNANTMVETAGDVGIDSVPLTANTMIKAPSITIYVENGLVTSIRRSS